MADQTVERLVIWDAIAIIMIDVTVMKESWKPKQMGKAA